MEENKNTLDIYSLSRNFWDFTFENPDKINTNHIAIYFFCIEHCNRLGWKERFGLPTSMVMEATGIKNWRTYSASLKELIDFGLIILHEKSKNQWSSNIIAIVKNTKAKSIAKSIAHTKALDKALQKHSQKQHTKQGQSTVVIDIQDTIIQNTNIVASATEIKLSFEDRKEIFKNQVKSFNDRYEDLMLVNFFKYWSEPTKNKKKMLFELQQTWDLSLRIARWKNNDYNKKNTIVSPIKHEFVM